ncbi:hypothetical protein L228DRAFT_250545 [Xylona heveae TC161]|uniref:Uncharacterized protein n=1 Tax=Xylona heveae (strain CBS 132557 / TC161) TaxID=1328760 RepID=A0A165A8U2_XYLHT|nr:hypothetical protein L228DRAFT_250545 [Xylona heveae TC161]KZF20105.1 hypothetical protein L228DRAFT_250545 [Xylona heveae TC161]
MPAFHDRFLLNTVAPPIAVREEYIAPSKTTITVKQNDKAWLGRDFTIRNPSSGDYDYDNNDDDDNGPVLFTVECKAMSNSQRREFRDASGLPLFELRRKWLALSDAWTLRLPGSRDSIISNSSCSNSSGNGSNSNGSRDANDANILTGSLKWSLGRPKFDVKLRNAAVPDAAKESDKYVTLEVRGQDSNRITTHVSLPEGVGGQGEGKKVMQIRRSPDEMKSNFRTGRHGYLWEVGVAEGVDLALVSFRFPGKKTLSPSPSRTLTAIKVCCHNTYWQYH